MMSYDNGRNHDSSQFDTTNTGVLFKNDRKEPNSRQPDYKGNLNVNGTTYRLAAWTRTSRDGTKRFLSLKIESADARPASSHTDTHRAHPQDEDL